MSITLKQPHPLAIKVFSRAFAEGVGWVEVRKRAGVAVSTWRRIAKGGAITSTTIDRLEAALDDILAEAQGTTTFITKGAQDGTKRQDDHG